MLANYRNLFLGLDEEVLSNENKLIRCINFDNAATTPPFSYVMSNIYKFCPCYSSVKRGAGYKSEVCSELYEQIREGILNFFNAPKEEYNVIFVKNTTEGINKLACRLVNENERVLSTFMEHHSNDLPWRGRCILEYVDIDKDGRLNIEDLEEKLYKGKGSIKYVTVTGASNVTGYVNPLGHIARLCHNHGAHLIVDGAQLAPHKKISMKGKNSCEDIDYLVFSAHKMYAPFGVGAIIFRKNSFLKGMPEYRGGGTVKIVTKETIIWEDEPYKEEAGTPNLMGAVALLSAIRQLEAVGMDKVEEHERKLTDYALEHMKTMDYLNLYGESTTKDRLGIISFNYKDIYHEEAVDILAHKHGIGLRSGCFCAQPYVQRLLSLKEEDIKKYLENPGLKRPGMIRASFGLYNNTGEIDVFLQSLEDVYKSRNK